MLSNRRLSASQLLMNKICIKTRYMKILLNIILNCLLLYVTVLLIPLRLLAVFMRREPAPRKRQMRVDVHGVLTEFPKLEKTVA